MLKKTLDVVAPDDDVMPEVLIKLTKLLKEKYPVGVPRRLIGEATGCVLNSRTCANLDCKGDGIPGRYKVGRQTVYPVDGIIKVLKSKMIINL